MKGQPSTFWGKLRKVEGGEVVAWHPLIDHCADVAACCEALLAVPVVERRLARLAGRDALDEVTQARLSVLCALHDLGKFNHGFQRKAGRGRDVAGHVIEALALLDYREPLAQQFFAAIELGRFADWSEGDGTTLLRLWTASIAHHGRPQETGAARAEVRLWLDGPRDAFAGARTLVEATTRWFPTAWESGPALPAAAAFSHAFNGLVTLADWLGSDRADDAFPYTEEADYDLSGEGRMAFARARAARVMAAIGLDARRARVGLGSAPGFDRISDYTPKAAQTLLHALPAERGGSITVLEAETGSGKTEAALARFMTLFAAGEVDGLYFALPTRTSATQLHARVTKAVARAWSDTSTRPPVVLAVPGYLRVDDTDGRRLPEHEVLWNDREGARWRFRGWAAEHPKRFLAGAVVVGTIDQVLLSAMRVDHAHLRATSLLRHLLVVDEVHASDAYMTRLLETVLARHRAAGGHALLLSATLGAAARARLLQVGARRPSVPSLAEAVATPYPLVSHRGADGIVSLPVAREGAPRAVRTEIAAVMDDAEAIARRALAAARDGARVLVVRNTVAGCRAVQAAVEAAAGVDSPLLLRCAGVAAPHHSRFAQVDRAALDAAVEAAFGRERDGIAGVVAVATQTVEQSLDLDADLLITDLCPMDVLLQRIGRLHRHQRPAEERPAGFRDARAVVLVPASRDLAATIALAGERRGWGKAGHGLGSVYADLRVIEATWRSLTDDPVLVVPSQCRARVEAAVHPDALAAVTAGADAAAARHWAEHERVMVGETTAKDSAARLNLFEWSDPFGHSRGLFPEKGERRLATRLGDDDRLFDFGDARPRGPFGERIRQLKAPGWMTREVAAEPVIAVVGEDADGFDFTVDGARWRYDRHGLQVL